MLRSAGKNRVFKTLISLVFIGFIFFLLSVGSDKKKKSVVKQKKMSAPAKRNLKGMSLKLKSSLDILDKETVSLFKAVKNGKIEKIKHYLNHGGDPNIFYGKDRMSLLGASSYYGEFNILKLLLDSEADVSYIDERGNSILMLSFKQDKNKGIYKELLEFEEDFNYKNKKGETALFLALKSFNEEAVKEILKQTDLSDENLQKSFFESVLNQEEKFMGLVYDKFPRVMVLEDAGGETATKSACRQGLLKSMAFLMQNQPEDLRGSFFLDELLNYAKDENEACYEFLTSI